jgi:hypothetical protein
MRPETKPGFIEHNLNAKALSGNANTLVKQ